MRHWNNPIIHDLSNVWSGTEEGRLVRKILRKYESLFANTDNFEPLNISVVPTPGKKDIFDQVRKTGAAMARMEYVPMMYTVKEETVGEETVSEETVSEETVSEETVEEETIGEATVGEETVTRRKIMTGIEAETKILSV